MRKDSGEEKVYPEAAERRLMEEMTMRGISSVKVWVAAAMLAAGVMARAQAVPAPAAPCTAAAAEASGKDCQAGPATAPSAAPQKDTAQRFPFPGESPSAAERPADAEPDAPAAPEAKTPKKALPAYPGDPEAPAAGESSSSSSSSSAMPGDPAADEPGDNAGPLKDAGSTGEDTKVPVPARRKKLPKVNPETPESRAAEDLTVAEFYMNGGNYAAAYLRAKDAAQYQPNDPYAHFSLAEAARKLGKRDEAKEHYEQVLKLDPIPKQKKASERALAEMASTAKK